jgi:hypothetical protein
MRIVSCFLPGHLDAGHPDDTVIHPAAIAREGDGRFHLEWLDEREKIRADD